MQKVVLPREVARALEKAMNEIGNHEEIAWSIPGWEDTDGYRHVLHRYALSQGNFFRLVDAMRYGYKVSAKRPS